jgi:hypothetical protein
MRSAVAPVPTGLLRLRVALGQHTIVSYEADKIVALNDFGTWRLKSLDVVGPAPADYGPGWYWVDLVLERLDEESADASTSPDPAA